uniref:Uncharacterized protein n=1 Tax=Arundo donax TaxID=35708 RepID=A0A0A9EIX6_ARUDO
MSPSTIAICCSRGNHYQNYLLFLHVIGTMILLSTLELEIATSSSLVPGSNKPLS